MIAWWQVLVAMLASGAVVAWAMLEADVRRQRRRREDRQTYREFMEGRWTR